jgi:TolB-like protein
MTGQQPFRAETLGDTLARVLEREPDWNALPSKLPVQVRESLERCLRKDKQNRLGDMAEARRQIEEALLAPRQQRMPRRKALTMAGTAVVMLVTIPLGLNVGRVRDRLLGTGLPEPIHSIAVLPLANLSGDPDQEYFAEGMHDALITDLAKLSGLDKVIARASVMRYRDSDQPPGEIAQELGVEAMVTGSVVREDNRVRITAQLVDASTEEQLWADRYERELSDVLSLQNEIVMAITRELELQLTSQEQIRLASTPTVNPEAYEAYLQGRFHMGRLSAAELDTALAYYDSALEIEPDSALAYAGIAFVWAARQQMGFVSPQEAAPLASEAALRALDLDDTLADAHFALAGVRSFIEWGTRNSGGRSNSIRATRKRTPSTRIS